MNKYDYGHLEETEVRREDQKLYKFREGDFLRLRLQDIEDMLLILVQKKLTNLTIDEWYDLNVALRWNTAKEEWSWLRQIRASVIIHDIDKQLYEGGDAEFREYHVVEENTRYDLWLLEWTLYFRPKSRSFEIRNHSAPVQSRPIPVFRVVKVARCRPSVLVIVEVVWVVPRDGPIAVKTRSYGALALLEACLEICLEANMVQTRQSDNPLDVAKIIAQQLQNIIPNIVTQVTNNLNNANELWCGGMTNAEKDGVGIHDSNSGMFWLNKGLSSREFIQWQSL
ncbi:hypothetical protein Tco_0362797 [Tanacetum coccineum]